MIQESFNAPGDIIWDHFFIVNSANNRADILGMSPEIHIFEDIFTTSMTGWLLMVDTVGIIDKFPILGQEELHVKFHTPGFNTDENTLNKKFRIVAVTDRKVTGNKQTYILHFVSYDAYADMTMKETRAFSGSARNIISDILNSMWKQSDKLSTSKNSMTLSVEVEPQNNMKFVSPQWSPLKCCNYVASNSISGEHRIADFFFWESRLGYNLRSLTEMFMSEPVDFFKYDASTGSDINTEEISNSELMKKVSNLTFKTNSNQVDRILNHGYGVKTITHDLLTKRIHVENIYKPKNIQFTTPSLNGSLTVIDDKDIEFNDNFVIQVANSCSWAHNEVALDNSGLTTNTRKMMTTRLGFTELDIEAWGRSWIQSGQVVWMNYGNYDQTSNNTADQESALMTGKYLVTAVHHMLAPAQHKMSLQIVKESTKTQVKAFA